jgi:hypothetical protein
MQSLHDRKNSGTIYRMQPDEKPAEQEPMHPDDFVAHLAWITAKRYHELVLGKTHAEKPVYYRILG